MLTIKNIDELKGRCIRQFKVSGVITQKDLYTIKVLHDGSPFDMFNLMIQRIKTKNGDYRISCFDNGAEGLMPIECMRNRDEFITFLIDKLI
jgi:hypothetical protein